MRTPSKTIARGVPLPHDAKIYSLKDLCAELGIPCKVSGPAAQQENIYLVLGSPADSVIHCLADDGREFFVINEKCLPVEEGIPRALRVLELLAYVFDHYGARECVKGRFA